jgi:tetratricopeptide (TPR) repeat protein
MSKIGKSGAFALAAALALAIAVVALGGCARGPKDVGYLDSGKKFLAQKDYARAVLQFRNAIRANPRNAEAHYQLGAAYLEQRDWTAAYEELTKALELNPNHHEAQVKVITLLASARDLANVEKARQKAQDFLAASPDNPDVLNALATTEFKLGKPEDAIKTLEQASSKAPQHLQTAVALAKVRLQRRDARGAERVLMEAVNHNPDSIEAHLILSSFYLALGKDAECEQQVRWILAKDSNEGRALEQLAPVLEAHKRNPEAEEAYRKLSQLADANYQPRYAEYLFRHGRQKEALAELERLYKLHPDDAASRARLVEAYVAANQISDAERVLDKTLAKNSKDASALIQRSRLDLRAGKTEEAQARLNKVLHFDPISADAHYFLAKTYHTRGDTLGETQELREAVRLRPDFLAARLDLARAMMSANAAQSAFDLMDALKDEKQKNNVDVIAQRNWALLALHRTGEARKEVVRGLAIARTPDLLMQDADLKMQEKDYSGGRASLTEALNRSPEDLRPLRLLVASFVAQKQPAAGLAVMREYTNRNPKSARAQQYLGELLMANHQIEEARAALAAAKAADPTLTEPDVLLAELDARSGRRAEAIKNLSTLLARKPGDIGARMLLATYQDASGNRPAAIAEYGKIVQMQPANLVALNNLALDLAEGGNPDEALKHAQKAAELAPDSPAVADTLGWVMYKKGLYAIALQHLEKADKAEPTAPRKCHLAMTYFKLGDAQRGFRTLQAATRMDPKAPEIQAAQELARSVEAAQ